MTKARTNYQDNTKHLILNKGMEDYLDKREARKMDRFTQFALVAAKEAFADAM